MASATFVAWLLLQLWHNICNIFGIYWNSLSPLLSLLTLSSTKYNPTSRGLGLKLFSLVLFMMLMWYRCHVDCRCRKKIVADVVPISFSNSYQQGTQHTVPCASLVSWQSAREIQNKPKHCANSRAQIFETFECTEEVLFGDCFMWLVMAIRQPFHDQFHLAGVNLWLELLGLRWKT